MLIIGSHALNDFTIITRKPKDYDFIGTFSELNSLVKHLKSERKKVVCVPFSENKTIIHTDQEIIEFEIAWSDTAAAKLLNMHVVDSWPHRQPKKVLSGIEATVPNIDELYTLKMSHRYLKNSPHFRKTHDDIMLMRKMGAMVFDYDWLKQRENETYVYKHPKLNVMKNDFFKGDGVQYVYDHDTIHDAVQHLGKPAYTFYMKDNAPVMCDKNKFFALSEEHRLYGVLEEAQVLALERSQIPFKGSVDARKSFDMALMKVCTSITSGWFREFAWENFRKVESMYEPQYVEKFWDAVEKGIVKKL